jgi:hypothetical protein
VKALIRGGHLSCAVNLWTRHATPQPFAHLLLQGVSGRGVLAAIDPAASGLFVFGHPTLGNWSALPGGANSKLPSGGPLHVYAGVTPNDGGVPLSAADFAALDVIELYVRGHVKRYINGETHSGKRYLGLQLDNATLIDALDASFVVWRTGEDWDLVDADYKDNNGSPIVDITSAIETSIIVYAENM